MITISGYSDDIVCVEATDNSGNEFDDCARQTVRSFLVGTEEAGIVVRAVYAPAPLEATGPGTGATWQMRIDLVNEDVPIPWPVRIVLGERGYTPAVEIDCPDGTPWRLIHPRDSGEAADDE